MSNDQYVAGYAPASQEAHQFFALVRRVFSLDLSPLAALDWQAMGYRCHSLLCDGQMVANVSALRMTLQILGEPATTVQLGAMAVDPAHRGQGLARQLLERVFEEYADVERMLLFANETVLDFYPRFGFRPLPQYTAVYELPAGTATVPVPSALPVDSAEAGFLLTQPMGTSRVLDARGNPLALWANLRLVCPDCLFALGEDRAMMAQQQGDTLHIFDVFATGAFNLLPWTAWPGVRRLCFHFNPDWLALPLVWHPDPDEAMFVRGPWPDLPPFCFPATAKT